MTKRLLTLIVITGMLLSACDGPAGKKGEEPGEILIVYTDWAESVAMTHLAGHLLEQRLGYKVVLKLADVDQVFHELATAEADVFLDVWLPATHESYMKQYAEELEDLGPNYLAARTGLVVPEYMPVESIGSLSLHYDGPITGIDSTAGIMKNTYLALDAYGLENELLVLSDAEMSARLEQAVKRREPIVITGWEPHWLFHRYALKYLDDSLEVYMEEERIHSLARSGFTADNPNAATFFQRMLLSERQMNALLYELRLNPDPLQGVKEWIKKNEFIVNQWTKGLGVEREKIM